MAENSASALLEAKSNELEIIEFSVKDVFYGINVAKVREIIKAGIPFIPVPDAHASIRGAINLRGQIIPVVDLARHLNLPVEFDVRKNRVIITEFNRISIGFLVTSVSRIHRLSWKSVEVPSKMLQTGEGYASGIVRIGERVIFLLDFEKVASHINPRANIQPPRGGEYAASAVDRSAKRVLVVDDSDFTRQMVVQHLSSAGYQTEIATNGEEAWQMLTSRRESTGGGVASYHLMVTDIEMPQLDGLHLIQRIKEDLKLRRLPCLAFSSIISPDVVKECRRFGADGEISKPEIGQLVSLVDSRVLGA